jgi:hypothetical protein
VGLGSLRGKKAMAVARSCTGGEAGTGASAPRGAGPKVGAPGNFEIGVGVEMGPNISGGSEVEGTSFTIMWVELEADGSEAPGPRLCT